VDLGQGCTAGPGSRKLLKILTAVLCSRVAYWYKLDF
jgi:hypothetical protein